MHFYTLTHSKMSARNGHGDAPFFVVWWLARGCTEIARYTTSVHIKAPHAILLLHLGDGKVSAAFSPIIVLQLTPREEWEDAITCRLD